MSTVDDAMAICHDLAAGIRHFQEDLGVAHQRSRGDVESVLKEVDSQIDGIPSCINSSPPDSKFPEIFRVIEGHLTSAHISIQRGLEHFVVGEANSDLSEAAQHFADAIGKAEEGARG